MSRSKSNSSKGKSIGSTTQLLKLLHIDLFNVHGSLFLSGTKCCVVRDDYSRFTFIKYKNESLGLTTFAKVKNEKRVSQSNPKWSLGEFEKIHFENFYKNNEYTHCSRTP